MKNAITHALVAVGAAALVALGFTITAAHDTRTAVAEETEKVEARVEAGVQHGIEKGARAAADEILSLDYLDQRIDRELGRLADRPAAAAAGAVRRGVILLERLESILGEARALELLQALVETAGRGPTGDLARVPLEEGLDLLRALLRAPPVAAEEERR